jgi:hypothetical protein
VGDETEGNTEIVGLAGLSGLWWAQVKPGLLRDRLGHGVGRDEVDGGEEEHGQWR